MAIRKLSVSEFEHVSGGTTLSTVVVHAQADARDGAGVAWSGGPGSAGGGASGGGGGGGGGGGKLPYPLPGECSKSTLAATVIAGASGGVVGATAGAVGATVGCAIALNAAHNTYIQNRLP